MGLITLAVRPTTPHSRSRCMKLFHSRAHLVITLLSLTMSLMVTAQEEKPVLPPELTALDAQFQLLQKERVTLPFDLDLAKLNTSYFGGLEKAKAAEKAKGDLDATLALENEKQAFTKLPELPEKDDPTTPEVLKKLRATYRSELARINAVRVASLSALTEPLGKRLAQMEKDLTKTDRLEDAKKVRAYREALVLSPNASPAALAVGSSGFTNTLGMKFLPVKGTQVMFCIHEIRRQDYAAFAADAQGVDESWKTAHYRGIPCGDKDDHPVVRVSWEDAVKFCEWLSKKEGKMYRLPTDGEWSIAVGLGTKEIDSKDATPEILSGREQVEFPWESDYAPKTADKPGNYADISFAEKFPGEQSLRDYTDGFPTTAPVMSLHRNQFGLYDMGGNVWEWVNDWWNDAKNERVLRGCSFFDQDRSYLLSSYRSLLAPSKRASHIGFRCVFVMP